MRARVISAESDEGGSVVLAIGDVRLTAMDHLGYGKSEQPRPAIGDEFVPAFSCQFDDSASWDSVFAGNPERRSELVPTGLWSYCAFGTLIAIDEGDQEAVARCGPCDIPLPIEVSDPSLVGAFVAFEVQRLDVWRA
jgi:hypothetical protein